MKAMCVPRRHPLVHNSLPDALRPTWLRSFNDRSQSHLPDRCRPLGCVEGAPWLEFQPSRSRRAGSSELRATMPRTIGPSAMSSRGEPRLHGMPTYVLLHGAGSDAWYWHLVAPRLRELESEVVAVDLPCDDVAAGLTEYVDTVVEAVGERQDLIVVAQSLAAFIGPLVCERLPVALLVLVNGMVPRPGETAGEWWANTGHVFPDPFDPVEVFLHDVPPEVAAQSVNHVRPQSDAIFVDPWPLKRWPSVPTRFLACRDDRFFPFAFQRRMVEDRLGFVPDEMPGGHLPALARPDELVKWLGTYRSTLDW